MSNEKRRPEEHQDADRRQVIAGIKHALDLLANRKLFEIRVPKTKNNIVSGYLELTR